MITHCQIIPNLKTLLKSLSNMTYLKKYLKMRIYNKRAVSLANIFTYSHYFGAYCRKTYILNQNKISVNYLLVNNIE